MQPWLTKQKSHEIFRSTASTVDIPNHWDLQQRRLRPVADARRSCWGSGQQDASATQGTRRMLGAATRNSKQQPTGLIACGAVRRRLVRAPSIVQTKRKTSTQSVLVFLGAMEGTRTPGLLIRRNRMAHFVHFIIWRQNVILIESALFCSCYSIAFFASLAHLCTCYPFLQCAENVQKCAELKSARQNRLFRTAPKAGFQRYLLCKIFQFYPNNNLT